MKHFVLAFFIFLFTCSYSQSGLPPRQGDHAPSFILNLEGNSIQSYVMPYMKRLVLLHFWSSDVLTSRSYGRRLEKLARRYKDATYKNAEGFEVIAIAVQANKSAWRDAIKKDSLKSFTHGLAIKSFEDEVCKKYGVTSLPTDILIDETGTIIAVDPGITVVEDILDDRKNFQPVKKDVVGVVAQSSNKAEIFKYGKLYLFNSYGDSIGKTTTSSNGSFSFSNVKLNQDFMLKVDNQSDIITSDPLAIYTPAGELLLNGKTADGGFVFYISTRIGMKLTELDPIAPGGPHLNIVKNLEFSADGSKLTGHDEKELLPIVAMLEKSSVSTLEFTTNTDAKIADNAAMDLTIRQAQALSDFFEKRGVAKTRLKGVPKGNDEPRVLCDPSHPCTEEQHKENRRVEFFVHRN